MNVSGIARKASVAVSGIVGVALLVLVLKDRDPPPPPEIEPKVAVEKPPAPEPAPQPETAKPLTMATMALPPPPMPEPPKAQPAPPRPTPPKPVKTVKAVKPMVPQPAPPPTKPIQVVKPMQPAQTPPPRNPAKALKPMQPEQTPPPPAKTVKPLRPEPKPAPVVHKPKPVEPPRPAPRTFEPLRPAPKAETAAAPPQPVEPLRPEPIEPLKPARKPHPPSTETPIVESPVEPEPAPEEPPTIKVSARTSPRVAKEGRALLRLLEHGSGPAIEISWPTDGLGRRKIFGLLRGCYGMRTVVMDTRGNLYTASGARARKWNLNLDRFSGFVRQPNGYTAPEERREATAIRRYHGMGRTGRVVRLFPRNVDALFLGGLKQALGERYKTARSIRATYRQEGSSLFIEGIVADGAGVDGRIAFAAVASCR